MKLEFISNTGFYLSHEGKVLGMDLWFTQGAFEGSWFHYPPLRETKFKVRDCDYIYISHIHPDHCDFNALKSARKEATFIVPNYFNNLLARKLNAFGFSNVVSMAPGEKKSFPDFEIEMFGQFSNNLFHDAAIGSLIDSAIMIRWGNRTILNCNDNYLTEEWARTFAQKYPKLDLLLAPHSASGPYPASFRNLSIAEKSREAERLQTSYIDHFVKMVDIIQPKNVVPCAAEYAIVGELFEKNPYIGLADAAVAAEKANQSSGAKGYKTKAFHMDCGTVFDLEAGELEGLPRRSLSLQDKVEFAKAHHYIPYHYQWEDNIVGVDFLELLRVARENMWRKQKALNWTRDYTVYFTIDEVPAFEFNFSENSVLRLDGKITSRKSPSLECFLSRQLFYSILKRKTHWNNAEGGLHIDFFRQPNEYIPEVFTLLSFLHTPEV